MKKLDKLQMDINEADDIQKLLKEKELVFKKSPEIFNTSYMKKYMQNKNLIYVDFLKNKDVIYNYDKKTNTYIFNNDISIKNNSNNEEKKELFVFFKNRINKFNNEICNNENEDIQFFYNNKISNPKFFDNKSLNYNGNEKINLGKERNKNHKEILNKKKENYNKIKNNNEVKFTHEDNIELLSNNPNHNSNSIFDTEKLNLKNKFLVENNELNKFDEKKMQMIDLNENLVNNLNYEIANINKGKYSALLNEMQNFKRPKSHNFNKFNEINNFQITNNLNAYNNGQRQKISVINKKHSNSNYENLQMINEPCDMKLSIEEKNTNFEQRKILKQEEISENPLKHYEENQKIIKNINKNNESEKNFNNHIGQKYNNSLTVFPIKLNKGKKQNYFSSMKLNNIDNYQKEEKIKKSESEKNSKDSHLYKNTKEELDTNKNLKVILNENVKLAYDQNFQREEINFYNFHTDISTDRFGTLAKIEQKDYKDNFNRLKNHLEYNTIQNKVLVSNSNKMKFSRNFFRKNKSHDINIKNNEIHKNWKEKLFSNEENILNNELSKVKNVDNLKNLTSEYVIETKSQISKDLSKSLNEEHKQLRDSNVNNFDKNKNLNKDFCPVSIILKTNFSWCDKLNSLKTPYSDYCPTKEGLKTNCNNNINECTKNYYKIYQKTHEHFSPKKKIINLKNNKKKKNSLSNESIEKEKSKMNNLDSNNNLIDNFNEKDHLEKENTNTYKLKQTENLKKSNVESELKFQENKDDEFNGSNQENQNENIFSLNPNLTYKSNSSVFAYDEKDNQENSPKNNLKIKESTTYFKGEQKILKNMNTPLTEKNEINSFSQSNKFKEKSQLEKNNNNSKSGQNIQIDQYYSKRSYISNSNIQNSNYINPLYNNDKSSPTIPKHIDSILNNSINLNDLYEKLDLKQTMKITSQNGQKNKIICLEDQKTDIEILKNSNNKNASLPKRISKIQIFKELIKTPPLPFALENMNKNIKERKVCDFSDFNPIFNNLKNSVKKFINYEKFNSIQDNKTNIKNELLNRYRKKKINIEEVLILHNTNIRTQLNPVKTKEFHMKSSMHRKDKHFGLKRTAKQNCFNKSETYQLKRENLLIFEKPIKKE